MRRQHNSSSESEPAKRQRVIKTLTAQGGSSTIEPKAGDLRDKLSSRPRQTVRASGGGAMYVPGSANQRQGGQHNMASNDGNANRRGGNFGSNATIYPVSTNMPYQPSTPMQGTFQFQAGAYQNVGRPTTFGQPQASSSYSSNGFMSKGGSFDSGGSGIVSGTHGSEDSHVTLRELQGRISEECRTTSGSRLIQDALASAKQEDVKLVFTELLQSFDALASTVSGNRVLQKLFEITNVHQKAKLMPCLRGRMVELAQNQYGCFVAQRAIETFPPCHRRALAFEFKENVVKMAVCSNGNHVLQKVIEFVDPCFLEFMIQEVCTHGVRELAQHSYGCRVVQRLLEYFEPEQLRPLIVELAKVLKELAPHQFGNYVAQTVFEANIDPAQRGLLINAIRGELKNLSTLKCANYVVEKCLAIANPEQCILLIDEMLGSDGNPFLDILQDPFGNYVAQEMLEKAGPDQLVALAALIRSKEKELRLNVHARAAIAKYTHTLTQALNTALSGAPAVSGNAKPQPVPASDGTPVKEGPADGDIEATQIEDRAEVDGLLERLKADAAAVEWDEILMHLESVALNQEGAKLLQTKLDSTSDEDKEKIGKALLDCWTALVYDVQANYVLQKFLDVADADLRSRLIDAIAPHTLKIGKNVFETANAEQRRILTDHLKSHVVEFAEDRNGYHVIQKMLEVVPDDDTQFVAEEILGNLKALATNLYSSRILQPLFKKCTAPQHRSALVDEMSQHSIDLATDQYGNNAINCLLEQGTPEERSRLIDGLVKQHQGGAVFRLAHHKFGYQVIQKCLEFGSSEDRGRLITVFCTRGGRDLGQLLLDQYANYVIQKALEVAESQLRLVLVGLLQPHFEQAKNSQNVAHRQIVSKIEQYFAT